MHYGRGSFRKGGERAWYALYAHAGNRHGIPGRLDTVAIRPYINDQSAMLAVIYRSRNMERFLVYVVARVLQPGINGTNSLPLLKFAFACGSRQVVNMTAT